MFRNYNLSTVVKLFGTSRPSRQFLIVIGLLQRVIVRLTKDKQHNVGVLLD